MKNLLSILVLSLFCTVAGRAQSLSLPSRLPVNCSAQAGCKFSVYANETAVLIARFSSSGQIIGSLGETWSLDQCSRSTGTCAWHANFTQSIAGWCGLCGDTLKFSGNDFSDVFILTYRELWTFDQGNAGTYDFQNDVWPDCTNGGSCPYVWTLPIETDAGALIVSWLDSNSAGPKIVTPGHGYTIEASDNVLFIEDMIAPVSGVYIGAFLAPPNHWLAGVAAYKRI